jgi:hypothetical protein
MTAKVLATEDIRVSKAKVKTACFDLKERHLILPMWDGLEPIVEDMLVCHEVAHALFTPDDFMDRVKEKPFMKSYLNVLEDARVEKLFKERYNGSRKSFVAAYKNLRETDFFGLGNYNPNELPLIDKINMFFKFGIQSGVKFTQNEYKIAERASKLVTWEDVVALAEDIYALAKQEKENAKKEVEELREQGMIENPSDEDEDGFDDDEDDDEGGSFDDDEDEEWDTDKKTKSTSGNEETDDVSENSEEGEEDDSDDDSLTEKTQSSGSGDEDEDAEGDETDEEGDSSLESVTDKMMNKRFEDSANVNGEAPRYIELSENYDDMRFLISYKEILSACRARNYNNNVQKKMFYDKFKNLSLKQVNHLVQQFEMRKAADVYSRRQIAKTGLIDVNKVACYKVKDDLFKRQTRIPTGQNHGMIMLLDWSSSMYDKQNIRHSLDQVQLLVTFCRKVNIPFRVYAFASGYNSCAKQNHKADHLNLLELFSSSMTLTEHNEMMENTTSGAIMSSYSLSNTPLAPALLAMRKMIPLFKEETKAQKISFITFTDGGGNVSISPDRYFQGNTYFRDTVTKKNYLLSRSHRGTDVEEVNLFYQILKDRFNVTSISFFIGTPSNLQEAVHYSGRTFDAYDYANKIKASYIKDQFFKMTGFGRDAIYLVNNKMLVNKDFDTSSITGSMTSNKIAGVLRKSGKESLKGKILLEKFVETIA